MGQSYQDFSGGRGKWLVERIVKSREDLKKYQAIGQEKTVWFESGKCGSAIEPPSSPDVKAQRQVRIAALPESPQTFEGTVEQDGEFAFLRQAGWYLDDLVAASKTYPRVRVTVELLELDPDE